MNKMVTLSIAALMSTATLGVATPAAAQNGYYDRDGYSTYYSGYDRDDRHLPFPFSHYSCPLGVDEYQGLRGDLDDAPVPNSHLLLSPLPSWRASRRAWPRWRSRWA